MAFSSRVSRLYKRAFKRTATNLRLARRYRAMKAIVPTKRKPTTYSFKRKVYYENAFAVSAGGAQYAQAWQFQFGLLPNASDFTNLYDQYCIKKIVWKVIPKITQNEINSGSANNNDLPNIHSVLDYDDETAPTSIAQLCEYQNHKMTRGNMIHTRVIVPKVELATNTSGGVTSINLPKSYQWIDCDVTNINHRGIKVVIPPPLTAGTQLTYDVQVTYYFSCKNVL